MKVIFKKNIEIPNIDFVLIDLTLTNEKLLYENLFISCFGKRNNISLETFDWFNNHSPMGKNLLFGYYDTVKNCLIASYGLLPTTLVVENRTYKSVLCTNVMTHPDYAGKGLFKSIGIDSLEYAREVGYQLAFGVPNANAIKGHLSIGWEVVNRISYYEHKLYNISDDFKSPLEGYSYNVLQDNIEFESLLSKYDLYFTRNKSWLNWRASKPHSKYYLISSDRKGYSCYMVLKEYRDETLNIKKFHIVDFLYEHIDSFSTLLTSALIFSKRNQASLLNLWNYSFNKLEVEEMLKLGFMETESSNDMIIKFLDESIELPKENWHITLFDNDVY